jgi:putative colanic acid biosynthesis acetyltransferase WcaF
MIQDLKQFKLPAGFRGKSAAYVQLWWTVEATLFRLSPQPMYSWRSNILRYFGAKIGKKVLIRPTARVCYPWNLVIGDYSWVGDDVALYTLDKISIGRNTVVSQRSYLCTGSHDYCDPAFAMITKPITIQDECWLATDVFVAPGVTIANGTVVGARSSVYKDLPANMICIGNPAVPIKKRF